MEIEDKSMLKAVGHFCRRPFSMLLSNPLIQFFSSASRSVFSCVYGQPFSFQFYISSSKHSRLCLRIIMASNYSTSVWHLSDLWWDKSVECSFLVRLSPHWRIGCWKARIVRKSSTNRNSDSSQQCWEQFLCQLACSGSPLRDTHRSLGSSLY